jgi:hypothetical protein
MSTTIKLVFADTRYGVSKKSIPIFMEHHPGAESYAVQSSVPPEVFDVFIDALAIQHQPAVTADNVSFLSLLATEFFVSDLEAHCSTFSASVDQIASLSERVCRLEAQMFALARPSRAMREEIKSHERGLESLRVHLEGLKHSFDETRSAAKSVPPSQQRSAEPPALPPGFRPLETLPKKIEVPMGEAGTLDGIISYLAKNSSSEIVRLTSKSVRNDDPTFALRNVADLTTESGFMSWNEPGQWVCWEFHGMRVRVTDYTIHTQLLRSWVVEGSLDGEVWRKIDRRSGNQDFNERNHKASFAVSYLVEAAFIRLTQTGLNHGDHHDLLLYAVEFFGTLSHGERTANFLHSAV